MVPTAYESELLLLNPEMAVMLQEADPGPAAPTLLDNFVAADGTVVSARAADSGDTWSLNSFSTTASQITNNRARFTSGSPSIYHSSDVPASPDYVVDGRITCVTNINGARTGIHARYATTTLNGYGAYFIGGFNGWFLYKNVNGTETQLGFAADAALAIPGASKAFSLKVDGTMISVIVEGVVVIEAQDSAISAANRAGFYTNLGSATTGYHLDHVAARPIKSAALDDSTIHNHDGIAVGEFTLGLDGFAAGEGSLHTKRHPQKGGYVRFPGYTPFAPSSSRSFIGSAYIDPSDTGSPQVLMGGEGIDGTLHFPVLEAVYEGADSGLTRVHWLSDIAVVTVFGPAQWFAALPIGEEFHYMLTVIDNGTTQACELFINGVSLGAGVNVPGQPTFSANSGNYLIGMRGQGNAVPAIDHALNGYHGAHAVVNRIVTPTELSSVVAAFLGYSPGVALITPVAPSLNGQVLTEGAAANGDTFERRQGDSVLVVNNGSGASINVTIVSRAVPDPGEAVSDKVVAVAAGARSLIGPFPQQFEDASGLVTVNYSATASVTRAVIDQS